MTLLQAIAREEGFYVAGSRAQRNSNPGNIEAGRFANAHGAIGSDGRFAIFPDARTGFACMEALFQSAYLGLTVEQAIAKWAPSNENDVALYVAHVCEWVGCEPTDDVETLLMEAA